jgi:protein SCO1/2
MIAGLAAMTLLMCACANAAAPDSGPAADGHSVSESLAPESSFSVYDLPGRWHDQQDLSLTLRDLTGRPRIVALVYTSCAHACPRILHDMKRIEGELRAEGIDAGLVMVSIDPERDTPARLAEYARATLLDPNDWTLLTGTADGVLELAALLGVRYRRVGDSEYEHANVITLLDAEGRIRHRQVGLGAEPAALVKAAAGL